MERLERIETINELLDIYGMLLTRRQWEALSACYQEDLTLAEIAEITGGTRQAAHDLIRRGEHQLQHYEEQLHVLSAQQQRRSLLEQLKELLLELPLGEEQRSRADALLEALYSI
ncbi:MAG: sigma factor-like helix-turn-helix DNA-binding protein [Bacillota bacterium]|nr:sigma factor-like helix-turn-helix DNA-binding protein [Bacillota bacterium]